MVIDRQFGQFATVNRTSMCFGSTISSTMATAKSSAEIASPAGTSSSVLYEPVRSPGAISGAGEMSVQGDQLPVRSSSSARVPVSDSAL